MKNARPPVRSRGGSLHGAAVEPRGSLGGGGAGAWGQGGSWRGPSLCGARRGYALNCSLDLQRARAQPPPLADLIFCTVAGSCRIVAGQLPDSCRLFFTQLPPFWLEKGLILQNLLFSNQNDGNCVTNKRQLSGNWPATIRQLPATVQKIGSAKEGGGRAPARCRSSEQFRA